MTCPVRSARDDGRPATQPATDLSDLTESDSDADSVADQAECSDGLTWEESSPGLAAAIAEELDNL